MVDLGVGWRLAFVVSRVLSLCFDIFLCPVWFVRVPLLGHEELLSGFAPFLVCFTDVTC